MRVLYFFALLGLLSGCKPSTPELKTGDWRGILSVQGKAVPFNFEVGRDSGHYIVYLKNGAERLLLNEVTVKGDSVTMVLHIFDAALHAKVEGGKLSGVFVRNYAPEYKFPFTAHFGEDYRFEKPAPAAVDFTGKYAVRFFTEKDTLVSVGLFTQQENHVTGTFLMSDGDYRYLEGNVAGDTMKLSTFDGNHLYLFTARKSGDVLSGDFYAGQSSHQTWTAHLDESAKLPDAESITRLKPGFTTLDFQFPDLNKKLVGPRDERFRNKVLIVQVSGTWCPNCMDETMFLAPWYKKNKDRGVEIIGLAYERKPDFEYARARVAKMKARMGVSYEYLIAGTNDKQKTAESLPGLNGFIGFPTTIFIGKDGKVKKIHAGFSGPGTGIYYEQFKQRFDEIVNELLNEK